MRRISSEMAAVSQVLCAFAFRGYHVGLKGDQSRKNMGGLPILTHAQLFGAPSSKREPFRVRSFFVKPANKQLWYFDSVKGAREGNVVVLLVLSTRREFGNEPDPLENRLTGGMSWNSDDPLCFFLVILTHYEPRCPWLVHVCEVQKRGPTNISSWLGLFRFPFKHGKTRT